MTIEVRVPQLPESVADATLVTWHKQPGDVVARDENLADLETDKVVLEVPAPIAGVLVAVTVAAGTTVTGGVLLAVIDETATATAAAAPVAAAAEAVATAPTATDPKMSPAAKRVVEERGLDPATVPASGRDGRITNKMPVRRPSRRRRLSRRARRPVPRRRRRPARGVRNSACQ